MNENNCTFFPERSFNLDWSECCLQHDNAYTLQIDRAVADKELFKCVYESTDNSLLAFPALLIALVMYIGVRAFGKKFYNKK